ncbi:MAG: hypothetical protein ACK56I_35010, partial [bacterium]
MRVEGEVAGAARFVGQHPVGDVGAVGADGRGLGRQADPALCHGPEQVVTVEAGLARPGFCHRPEPGHGRRPGREEAAVDAALDKKERREQGEDEGGVAAHPGGLRS